MVKKAKIVFKEGEDFCRYKGILMNSENTIKMFGTDNTEEITNDEIIAWSEDGTIYTDLPLSDVIRYLSYKETKDAGEWDPVLTQGSGFWKWDKEKEVENSVFIKSRVVDWYKTLKPMRKFRKDHPGIKVKKIIDFNYALDKYYEDLKNNGKQE